MDSATAGLIGIAVGAGITMLNERVKWGRQRQADDLKWERESQVRYNADRVTTYATFLRTGHELVETGWKDGTPPNLTEFTIAYYSVELLASPPVREAAKAYHETLGLARFESRVQQLMRAIDPPRQNEEAAPGPGPAAVGAWDEKNTQTEADTILDSLGHLSFSTRKKLLGIQTALLEAIRAELGVAALAAMPTERAKRPIAQWRPFRRKAANKNAAPEGGAGAGERSGR